jgi:hypothetical protein
LFSAFDSMATKQIQKFCSECGRNTLHAKEIFGGGWGCLLTILTGGLFLPVWFLADVLGIIKPYRCQICGKAN